MKFVYDTGLGRRIFQNARLVGSWDGEGRYSDEWSESPMREAIAPDGAIVFEAEVRLAPSEEGKEFHWCVVLDGPLALRDALVRRSDAFLQTFTESLMTYALGRRVEYFDMHAVRNIVRAAGPEYRFSSLLTGIVKSVPFQMKRKEGGSEP